MDAFYFVIIALLLVPYIAMFICDCISCSICGSITCCSRQLCRQEELNAAELAQLVAVEHARMSRRPAAADPATAPAVKKELGYFPFSAAAEVGRRMASGESQLACAICLEVFMHGATCSEVPSCRHLFHRDCIALWMRSKSSCPLCRVHIVPESEPLSAVEDMV